MRAVRKVGVGLFVPVLVILGYGLWSSAAVNPFFPDLPTIMERFRELWLFSHVPTDVVPSLRNFALGYLTASVAAIAVGTMLGRIRPLQVLLMPLLDFFRSVPAIMLVPPLVLIMGIGDVGKVTIIAVGAFFPIVLATIDGTRRIEPALVDVCRALQLPRWKQATAAWLPAAAPAIAGGMQTGMQFALVLMVSSEMLASVHGVGYLTMQAQQTYDSASVWAGIVLLAIFGFLLNAVFVVARNRILAWHTAMRAASHQR